MIACNDWLALMIGNSRLHWAWFQEQKIIKTWNSQHLCCAINQPQLPSALLPPEISAILPLFIASVVPSQTQLWQNFPQKQLITLEQIPLDKLYNTIGIDRALAALGAGDLYGFPCLVIDAGTALTLTGVDSDRALVGGAILPGLKLQFETLAKQTAALPKVVFPSQLPPRWAMTTSDAITSGIIYTILAGLMTFIKNWWLQFPESPIILTGGDSAILLNYLLEEYPLFETYLKHEPNIIFLGMRSLLRNGAK